MSDKNKKHTIIGNTMTKIEADISGFNYDIFDYEAKMVATIPDILILDSVFRVSGDIAVTLNNDGDHYFMVKIGQNKGIAFEQLNPPIRVASKAKIFGETFNTTELIEALKNPIFKTDDAPVTIHTKDDTDVLTMVYKCSNCNKLHLFAGHFTEDFSIDDCFKTEIKTKYLNKSGHVDYGFVTKKELLDVLETMTEVVPVLLEIISDEDVYTLTNVFKCSEKCPAIHLDSAYDDNHLSLN